MNLFHMYALMGDTKIGFVSSAAVDINEFSELYQGHKQPEVNSFTAMSSRSIISGMHHHDNIWADKSEYSLSMEIAIYRLIMIRLGTAAYR